MKFASRLRAWLNNFPVTDPINHQMAALLQIMLIGFIIMFLLAVGITLFQPSTTIPLAISIIRLLIGSLIFGIPLFLLRRGYYRSSVLVIISMLLALMVYATLTTHIGQVAETLTFFTLAILLAGLLIGRKTLIVVFAISAITVIVSAALRPEGISGSNDSAAIAANFILLNGLMSIFINYFGITLRNSLQSSLKREEELIREIAFRERAEERINTLNQELQNQVAELERFTYTVSHDLRNPLVTIKGFLGMLDKDIRENRLDRVQSDFQRIAGAAEKMDDLLTDLLELSRIGRIINPPMEIDTARLIRDALDNLDGRLRPKNIRVQVAPEFPSLYGDRTRLREVFENLIENAAKYVDTQPAPYIEIGTRQGKGGTIIFIKDNGIGIEERYQTRIFALFEKLNPKSEGSGIGLALVKRIIETHNGNIWVESEGLGKGSTFSFTIPDGRKPGS